MNERTNETNRRWLAPLVLLSAVCGFATGWIAATPRGTHAKLPPVDFTGLIELRSTQHKPTVYRPHAVHVDNRATFVSGEALTGPVTVVTLDGGRIKIAATEVTP